MFSLKKENNVNYTNKTFLLHVILIVKQYINYTLILGKKL